MLNVQNILNNYVNYLNKKNNDQNYIPTLDESTAVFNVTRDSYYKNIRNELDKAATLEEQQKIIGNFISSKQKEKEIEEQKKKPVDEKEKISKQFGVDIKDIENIQLNNGKNLFSFYDEKLGRIRLIENLDDKTLTEQLKDAQNNNVDYQSNDYQKNSDNIMKDRALNNSNRQELNMLDINNFIDHPEDYGRTKADAEELKNIKDNINIKYVNLDNNIILTEYNEVLEFSKGEYGLRINRPIKFKNTVETVSNEEKIDEELEKLGIEENNIYDNNLDSIDTTIEYNDFEDDPEFISSEDITSEIKAQGLDIKDDINTIKNNIRNYNPVTSEYDDERIAAFYEKMNQIYLINRENALKKKKAITMKLEYNNDKGNISMIVITVLTILLAFMIMIIIKNV